MDNANVGTYARRILKDTEDQRVQKISEVQKIFIKYVRLRAGCRDAYALQRPAFCCINIKNLQKDTLYLTGTELVQQTGIPTAVTDFPDSDTK